MSARHGTHASFPIQKRVVEMVRNEAPAGAIASASTWPETSNDAESQMLTKRRGIVLSPRVLLALVAFMALLTAGVIYVIIVLQNVSARATPPVVGTGIPSSIPRFSVSSSSISSSSSPPFSPARSTDGPEIRAKELRFRRTGIAATVEYEYEFEVHAVGNLDLRVPPRGTLPHLHMNSVVNTMLCCSTNSAPHTCSAQSVVLYGEGNGDGGFARIFVTSDDAPMICRLSYGMRI